MFNHRGTYNEYGYGWNSCLGYGNASLVIVTADYGVTPCFHRSTASCIEEAKHLRAVGFDALVFPVAVFEDIPAYIPLKDEAYV